MDYYIGSILLLPYNYAPMGTIMCDGRILNIAAYQALFALIGITYGGDGRTNFAIPNMLGQEPQPGLNYCIVTEGLFPVRQ